MRPLPAPPQSVDRAGHPADVEGEKSRVSENLWRLAQPNGEAIVFEKLQESHDALLLQAEQLRQP